MPLLSGTIRVAVDSVIRTDCKPKIFFSVNAPLSNRIDSRLLDEPVLPRDLTLTGYESEVAASIGLPAPPVESHRIQQTRP